ncbi:MAG TPA: TetR/AcrR family transcriptional regulator [Candidatus Binatia bacterium]|jgi:AcrR family transcriptional regulator|nr:TetR/AcrR family transcriptional regulator [Candidatus Binatia bacterium]
MRNVPRLTAEARKEAIVEAVQDIFAEKGFDGTTIKELAQVAGVSEALLYKHFPSKESLYAAMLDNCAKGPTFAEASRILELNASTSTLVVMVHFMMSHYVLGRPGDTHRAALNSLLVRSLLGDGELVRLMHKKLASAWLKKFEACLKAAAGAGEMHETPIRRELGVWFVQHVAFSLMLHLRPPTPAIDYKVTREELVSQATWFALLGLGLKEDAARRYYSPKALQMIAN